MLIQTTRFPPPYEQIQFNFFIITPKPLLASVSTVSTHCSVVNQREGARNWKIEMGRLKRYHCITWPEKRSMDHEVPLSTTGPWCSLFKHYFLTPAWRSDSFTHGQAEIIIYLFILSKCNFVPFHDLGATPDFSAADELNASPRVPRLLFEHCGFCIAEQTVMRKQKVKWKCILECVHR